MEIEIAARTGEKIAIAFLDISACDIINRNTLIEENRRMP